MSAGDERPRPADGPASPAEGYPVPGSPGDPARNPALISFWLLEPVADAAMTYFYAELSSAARATWADRDIYMSGPDHMIVRTARALVERGAPSRLIHYDLVDPRVTEGQ